MRLIDADALERIVEEKFHEHYGNTVYQFIHDFFRFAIRQIRKAPTIDPESLRPHGRWVYEPETLATHAGFRCSSCHGTLWLSPDAPSAFKHCPDCGAKMDLEET